MKFGRRGFLKGLGSLVAVIPLGLKTRTVPEVQKKPDKIVDKEVVKELDTIMSWDLYPVTGDFSCLAVVMPNM